MTARRLMRRAVVLLAVASGGVFAAFAGGATGERAEPHAQTLLDPYTATQQTLLPFGERSHWLQPWRGYLATVPAKNLLHGLGIVFNPPPSRADTVAKQIVAAGIHLARLEISWCKVSYADPPHLTDLGTVRRLLMALKKHHVRPLILLNGNHGCPGPLRHVTLRLAAPAHAGDREIVLDARSADEVVPGRTGLDATGQYKAAAFLITKVAGNRATLARPLPADMATGPHHGSTLRYEPFTKPGDASFEATMLGWTRYVGLVTSTVKSLLGTDQFDVEVWNELSFGSDFLDADTYYVPGVGADQRATEEQLLRRTIAYVRDPSHGLPHVRIGDGFSNERPWEAGSNVPSGLNAIDKHPYPPRRTFPAEAVFNRVRPVDALGQPEGTQDSAGRWHDAFIPSYTAFFPEYFLSGIQTETVIRDLSPITNEIYGTEHGRSTHPPGAPPPVVWLTEAGMDPEDVPRSVLPRFHAKGALRWATAWIGKGAARVYFYAASSPGWGLVDPGSRDGGPTLAALGRLTKAMAEGSAPVTQRRSIGLEAVSDTHDHVQFEGDGTPGHPALYDRDVLGFFPFQSSNRRVVIALYVMTRDLMHAYRPGLAASDPRRYDLPPEWFRLSIRGTSGLGGKIAVDDPLTGQAGAFKVVSRNGDRLVVDVALTDSPRLLVLSS